MKIKFWGAAGEVTGSQHLIETAEGLKILLDCGIYQGNDEEQRASINYQWAAPPNEIDFVILSHAHIDHCGKLPKLVKDGYMGPVFCTHATKDLAAIMLLDSAHIQEKDAEYHNKKGKKKAKIEPLYTTEDILPALDAFVSISYNREFKISDSVSFIFRDAGHLLGSASVELKIRQNNKIVSIGFTGDIGRPSRPILRDPVCMPPVDYLICESTYGGKVHESRVNSDHRLLEIVRKTCVENKGKLIIPSFSVGRTQEVVLALNTLHESGELPEIPVYVDSPLAINATQVFMMHPECFDKEMYEFMRSDPNPFGFNTLRYIKNVDDSKKLNDSSEPCIIISASGMAEAGRIKHHLFNHIEDPLSTVLFVGYCTPGSLGGQLLAGKESVYIFGEELKVNAAIQSIDAYSAHADQPEILQFLKLVDKSRLNKIFLVHGEPDRQLALKDALISEGYMDIELPEQGQEFICN